MELTFSDSLIPKLFPDPDKVVTRKVMLCQRAKSKLIPRAESYRRIKVLLVSLICIGLLIEFAIGFLFNDRLVSGNVADELTTADQILRGVGAFAMVVGVMGVVFGLHVALNRKAQASYRLAAAFAAVVLGTGLFLVAASIGNQVFASLFEKLWGGTTSAIQLDPGQGSADGSATEHLPFGLNLAGSAAFFLGVAFFVAICEVFWLHTRDKLAHVMEVLAEADLIISKYEQAGASKVQAIRAEQRYKQTQKDDYRRSFLHGKAVDCTQVWHEEIDKRRPAVTNIAKLPQEEYEKSKALSAKIEQAKERVKQIEDNPDCIQHLVEKVLKRHLQAGSARSEQTGNSNQEQAA